MIMMTKIYVTSDTHYGHSNILKFKRNDGTPLRNFKDIDEHDNIMVDNWNKIITPQDHVYHLGDVVINRRCLDICKRLMGHKRLVRGNHDIFKTKEYIDVGFQEIYGCRVFPKHNMILSHIPIHPGSLKEGWTNIHGHTHSNVVLDHNGHPDPRYKCVSVEQTSYSPVLLFKD
jgi:calcineurin-like phosphoesterase family protein